MTDKELNDVLILVSRGDSSAFEQLYNELSVPVFTVALRILRNRALAEDAVQEVFMKLYRSPTADISKPRAYIFRMAHNTALDILRSNPAFEDITEREDIPAPQTCRDPDITAALESLPREELTTVTLHINCGLKFREIAEITETPLGTVLWRYNKAIKRLRLILNGGTT